ncbi:hypothetical protein HPP92_015096 [Vanilla planifolia]|uniref:Uncharacterized protein n=1 Tax=Vanilla planifolia TaxID=51239 RepID=A0A835QIJ4_VANPL|nr:hypothetical protein HPP92_015096 [Vanilla planifolia]
MGDPGGVGGFEDKVAYFQAITGLEDTDLCTEILSAHNWDLRSRHLLLLLPQIPFSPFRAIVFVVPGRCIRSRFRHPRRSVILLRSYSASISRPRLEDHHPSFLCSFRWCWSHIWRCRAWRVGSRQRSFALPWHLKFVSPRGQNESGRLIPISASAAEANDFVATFERDFPLV